MGRNFEETMRKIQDEIDNLQELIESDFAAHMLLDGQFEFYSHSSKKEQVVRFGDLIADNMDAKLESLIFNVWQALTVNHPVASHRIADLIEHINGIIHSVIERSAKESLGVKHGYIN